MQTDEQKVEIRRRLNGVFCDVFDDDKIEIFDAMTAADLPEWDSLMHITLVVAVEKEFKVRLNAAEVGGLANVGAFLELLSTKAVAQ
jgi:acyl carrier protein